MGKFLSKKVLITGIAVIAVIIAAVLAVILIKPFGSKDEGDKASRETTVSSEPDYEPTASEPDTSEPDVSEPEPPEEKVKFEITSLKGNDVTVTDSYIFLAGESDIDTPLTLDGEDVSREADGGFNIKKELNIGKNTFTFVYGEETHTYTVRYKYTIVESYSPKNAQSFESGSMFSVNVRARAGSTVKATFGGKTVSLEKEIIYAGEVNEGDFINFIGNFTLPSDNIEDKNMGAVKFVATYKGASETYTSGSITCKKDSSLNYVAEIVAYAAETFNGNTADDNSNPKNNYLPKGTVDYCDSGIVYYKKGTSDEKSYYKLRSGQRVYVKKGNPPGSDVEVTKRYIGTLPDHNEITVKSVTDDGRHTRITLTPLWKAPFLLDILPQKYTSEATQNFTISEETYEYVEITFCYATVFNGTINFGENNRIFKSAAVKTENGKTVVKLYLKKKGMFYGWDCKYDSNGDMVFSFLDPAVIGTNSDNKYGVDLSGVKIVVDAGHGGNDTGAKVYGNKNHNECERNLNLAFIVADKLKALGAEVIMTRTVNNKAITADDRSAFLKAQEADFCISIHHDALKDPSANGFGAFHSNVFSARAAKFVDARTRQAEIYNRLRKVNWHYFFLARMTVCPVVLTENGFLSSPIDAPGIEDEETNDKKAEAIVAGIVDYFKYIQ